MIKKRFINKVVLITGGTSGIGKAIAAQFLKEGAKVCITGRNVHLGKKTAQELGKNTLFVQADVSLPPDTRKQVTETIKRFGKLDILVNCAGINHFGSLMETDESVWNMMMDINLKGTFLSIKSAYPYLKKSQGNIVNIASDVSLVGSTSIPVYSITKAGVWMLTRLLASELAPAGIRVNAILPANITPGMKHTIKKDSEGKWVEVPENPEGPDWVKPPIGRFGTADEVASTVLFLASSEANYCTGSGLLVDGALNAAQP